MRRLVHSLLRIVAGVLIGLALVFGALAAVLTQPTLGRLPMSGARRADPGRLRVHVEFLTRDVRPRDGAHPENLDRTAAYVREAFSQAGGRVEEEPFESRGATYRNVIASFGTDAGPRIVVGAHYDTFGELGPNPGADDNASGVAGLLELARLLGERETAGRIDLVAFTTEEPPFFAQADMGSAVHARALADAGVELWGMICLEMIGYSSPEQPWPNAFFRLLYPDTGDFAMVAGRYADRRLIRHLKRAMRGATDVDVHGFAAPSISAVPAIDASDHRSYWAHGYRAVLVSDTATLRNPYYHSELDTAETLDYVLMAGVVDGVLNAVVHAGAACEPADR